MTGSLTALEIKHLNKMNRASQDVSLGTLLKGLQDFDTNLGTMAYQSGSNVYITGGSITGVIISGSLASANYANSSGSAAVAGSAGDYYAGGTIESNLLKAKKYHYSGVRNKPTVINNGDGSITVSDDGTYALYSGSTGDTPIEVYSITGGSFALQSDITTYIYAKYNSGSPVIAATLNRGDVSSNNFTTEIPIYTVYRYGSLINIINWEDQSLALGEKLLLRTIDTDRFHRTSGLILGEYGTRNVSISSGSVWYGANNISLNNLYSGSPNNEMYLVWYSGSSWSGSLMTQYDNTRYQTPTGLAAVGSGKYVVCWVYRIISSTQNYCVFILGTSAYNQNQAIASTVPSNLPDVVQTQGILVGRIIVLSGASTSTQIDSAFDIVLTPTSLSHNDLSGLQGGLATTEYYHLTASDYGKLTTGSLIVEQWNDLVAPLTTAKVGANNKPSFDETKVGYLFPSADTSAIMFITAQMPHSWKEGSRIYPHVHWQQDHGGSPVFMMDYKWFNAGSPVSGSFQTYTMDQRAFTYTSGSLHQMSTGSGIDGTGKKISSILLIKLYRNDNVYSGNALTFQWDAHYLSNTFGSSQESAK